MKRCYLKDDFLSLGLNARISGDAIGHKTDHWGVILHYISTDVCNMIRFKYSIAGEKNKYKILPYLAFLIYVFKYEE